jgi:hypothetical protein
MMSPHSLVTIRSRLLLWPWLELAVKGFGWIIYILMPNRTEGRILWSHRIWNPTPATCLRVRSQWVHLHSLGIASTQDWLDYLAFITLKPFIDCIKGITRSRVVQSALCLRCPGYIGFEYPSWHININIHVLCFSVSEGHISRFLL